MGGRSPIGVALVGLVGVVLSGCAPADPVEEQADNAFVLVDGGHGGGWTYPGQASADGLVVVGFSGNSVGIASDVFHWTARGGSQGLLVSLRPPRDIDAPSPGTVFSVGLSGDASTVLGTAFRRRDDSSLSLFSWSATAGILDLGPLPGQRPADVRVRSSRDGRVVTATANGRAFRWSAAEGRVDLGTLPGDAASEALAISGDGRVIVGNSVSAAGAARVFRWTAPTGIRAVAALPLPSAAAGTVSCRTAGQLSYDGAVLFGECLVIAEAGASGEPPGEQWTRASLFRWTENGGTELIDVPAQCGSARPWRTTADGAVLVGWLEGGSSTVRATEQPSTAGPAPHGTLTGPSGLFRWTARSTVGGPPAGFVVLVPPPGFGSCEEPSGLSADGSVVVGTCRGAAGALQGVKWDRAGVGLLLQPPERFAESHPSSVSADGTVVAGHARQRAGTTEKDGIDVAMIWDAGSLPAGQQLIDRLRQQGLAAGAPNSNQPRILSAKVSSDGHTFFGEATDSRSNQTSWIARLP